MDYFKKIMRLKLERCLDRQPISFTYHSCFPGKKCGKFYIINNDKFPFLMIHVLGFRIFIRKTMVKFKNT